MSYIWQCDCVLALTSPVQVVSFFACHNFYNYHISSNPICSHSFSPFAYSPRIILNWYPLKGCFICLAQGYCDKFDKLIFARLEVKNYKYSSLFCCLTSDLGFYPSLSSPNASQLNSYLISFLSCCSYVYFKRKHWVLLLFSVLFQTGLHTRTKDLQPNFEFFVYNVHVWPLLQLTYSFWEQFRFNHSSSWFLLGIWMLPAF